MTAIDRLYYADPFLWQFTARVLEQRQLGTQRSLILDRSAFYPESGGQLGDRGSIGAARVLDVQLDDQGVVHHLVEGDLPAPGSDVACAIDAARRRLHMSLHTGQHILSRALFELAKADTVSSRLGETACTVDVQRPDLDEAVVARVEDLANSVVDDDVEVLASFPDPAELASLSLRRAPKVSENIRVVRIGDFDVTPCAGTHCTRSAQVGLIRVTGVERYKGGTRVSFAAGRRARERLAQESDLLSALGQSFSCAPTDVAAAVEKLRRQFLDAREGLGRARASLAERIADELVRAAGDEPRPRLLFSLEDASIEMLRAVAARLVELPVGVVLLAGKSPEGVAVLVQRGTDNSFDCGAFVRQVAQRSDGRGGGRPERAEGRLPPGADFEALASEADGSTQP